MSRVHVPESLRRLVIARASGRCEYCLLHQDDLPLAHHVDHIVPLKHGGHTITENLALACLDCNRRKGSDLTAIDPLDGAIVALFNPRRQEWAEHFALEGACIVGLTPVGRATMVLLRLNDPARVLQRQFLMDVGRYPLWQ
jgi:5-methylcytosine-specific restriction endonuclease McrA